MTAEAPMTLPGSRFLLGWWRELAPLQPRRLWYAHALVHRIEALVEVSGRHALEELHHALLAQISVTSPVSRDDLASTLGLSTDLLAVLLDRLENDGQLAPGTIAVTDAGRALLQQGATLARPERRILRFLDGHPPSFIALAGKAMLPLSPPTGWRFDLQALEAAISQSPDWKARHSFPSDVVRLMRPPQEPTTQDSPRVPLDRAEQAHLVLTESAREGRVLGLAVQPETWTLTGEVVWSVPITALTELIGDARPAWWRLAWQTWCQQRSLPWAEVEACRLETSDHRLIVHAPPRLLDRLRQGRSEALRGEAWLLAGPGRFRAAACIELMEG